MRVLITGISGQDGSYLAEHLLAKGYEVHGTLKRNSVAETQDLRIAHLEDKITTHYADMIDMNSLYRIVNEVKPDWIFNTAAQSHVRISFDMPYYTTQVNAMGVMNLLEVMRNVVPRARMLQCSSSEMFGNSIDKDGYQRLTTPMYPTSPYGIAKLFGYSIVRHYRHAYNMFCANSLCFNHSSPRRGSNFVESKIAKSAIEIKYGLRKKLALGNIHTSRDFGSSYDYTKCMILILENNFPDDWIVATGISHTIKDICKYVFSKLDMDYHDYLVIDPKYMRPEELQYLRGDFSKTKQILGWEPTYTFEMLLDELIEHWDKKTKESLAIKDNPI